MIWLLYAWLCWLAFNFGTILVASFVLRPDYPCHTGLIIVMPKWAFDLLTCEEWIAVYEHECGHRHHRHVWKNLVRRCFFIATTAERRAQQEAEADRHVCAQWLGASVVLASARQKIKRRKA